MGSYTPGSGATHVQMTGCGDINKRVPSDARAISRASHIIRTRILSDVPAQVRGQLLRLQSHQNPSNSCAEDLTKNSPVSATPKVILHPHHVTSSIQSPSSWPLGDRLARAGRPSGVRLRRGARGTAACTNSNRGRFGQ